MKEGLEDRVFADGRKASHIEEAAYGGSASRDMALAAVLAAVVIEGCEARKLGNGAAAQGAEFRKEAHESQSRAPIHTADLIEALGFSFELEIGITQGKQLRFEFCDFALEKSNDALGLCAQPAVFDLMEARFLDGTLGDKSLALCQQSRQAFEVLGLRDARGGVIGCSVIGNNAGVEAVGFGENTPGTGKVADLARVDDAYYDVVSVKVIDQGILVSAGGFANDVDAPMSQGPESVAEFGESTGSIRDSEGLVEETTVDCSFGDIGSEIDTVWNHGYRDGAGFGSAL